ncbi:MAG TPA: phosphoribosylformylglycinamidine synthase, purS protein [Acidimicrobiaceae bacterium]|nr:phosphoribosylformylglycinamidine synthase, purS protein [Acidimicrobiaceae bacterium]HCV33324.1 phosphoribosylformylglycinamidine synthase, purS protein [Acidimicrobiaceae bacterium]
MSALLDGRWLNGPVLISNWRDFVRWETERDMGERARRIDCEDPTMNYNVLVDVRLRGGIADPAGATIERVLPALGYEGVTGVSVGKTVRFVMEAANEFEAAARANDLSASFLTNPVIEDAEVTVRPADDT